MQIIFAGKAHPADEPGKQLIQRIANLRHDPRFAGRIAFVEDYDINVCRHLIQGVDVWLNNPRRPLEASGTSGQKAVLNGALNLSILDGWWAEAYDGANGFAIGKGTSHVDERVTDARDAADLYRVLIEEVIPLYYDRDIDGLPRHWIKRMMNSISSLAWRFSADRMVADYVRHAYLPASGGLSCDMDVQIGDVGRLRDYVISDDNASCYPDCHLPDFANPPDPYPHERLRPHRPPEPRQLLPRHRRRGHRGTRSGRP